MCIEIFNCIKTYLKELFKLFILTLYNFYISYVVLETLRFVWYVNDPNHDITLHNDLLKTLVHLWDYETKSLKMMHVHGSSKPGSGVQTPKSMQILASVGTP